LGKIAPLAPLPKGGGSPPPVSGSAPSDKKGPRGTPQGPAWGLGKVFPPRPARLVLGLLWCLGGFPPHPSPKRSPPYKAGMCDSPRPPPPVPVRPLTRLPFTFYGGQ